MKIHLRMLGCRLNQAEIDSMARQFQQQGHEIVSEAETADQVIVNTCAVTNEATRSSRKMIRDLHRMNAEAGITVTGCYAHIAPDEITVLPGVRRVVDNLGKDTLVSQLTGVTIKPFDHEPFGRDDLPGAGGRTRAFVKVQDGCDNACTFCITTVARGQGRSRPLADVVNEIQFLHETGFQEVVLTGVHLGSYGHDLGDPDGLKHLVRAVLTDTDIPRLRLSSLEPWDLSAGFFDLWKNPRLCPHLHLPLQSGCDATLKRMRRNTTQVEFRALVEEARARIPHLSLTTDVIAGFPGETDDEFYESKAFIEAIGFARLHVFPYSLRPGTPAARMKQQIKKTIKKARVAELLQLSNEGERHFAERFKNRNLPVLWEQVAGATEDGFVNVGYTDNYIRVRSIHPRPLTNFVTSTELLSYDRQRQHMIGAPILETL